MKLAFPIPRQYWILPRRKFSVMSESVRKQERSPVPAREAACVILVRPAQGSSYQILLVERMARDGSQFLNAHVFPGGQAEAGDDGNRRRTALRELYEEANIHLQPDNSTSSERPQRVIPRALQDDSSQVPYYQFLQSSNTPTAEKCLIPFSRWITPKFMPKRFDTAFFLALASPTDNPVDGKVDGQEIKSLAWLSPAEALSQFSSGKITLFPPQWYILSDLQNSSPTYPDLVKVCRMLPETPRPMVPQAVNPSKSGFTVLLHGDENYVQDEWEPKPKPGGRHRISIESKDGRPRRMKLERNCVDNDSKL